MASESGVAADATLVANQAVAAETVNAAAAPPPVRRGPPLRTNVILRPQPPHAHTLLSTTARTVAAGPLYGSRHTRMSVSSLAEAVAPS